MKRIHFSVRLSKAEHEKIKRYAKQSGQRINQVVRDMINGKRCLCGQHAMPQMFNQSNYALQGWDSFLNNYNEQTPFTLKLTFETLILLRLLVKQHSPELVEQARERRIKRFGLADTAQQEEA